MIAMQYSLVLPADYDMGIIDRRIADKGSFTDGLPGLAFKAYLTTRKNAQGTAAAENLYAPFYLWDSMAGMNDFLSGPGFVALTQSFGWPSVKSWNVWHAQLSDRLGAARFATRETLPIAPYTGLDALRQAETERASRAVAGHGAIAALAGFEPATWTLVRFQLWADAPAPLPGQVLYSVGHLSTR